MNRNAAFSSVEIYRVACVLLALQPLGIAGCASPLYSANPAVFQGRPQLAIVSFDSYEWDHGVAIGLTPPARDALAAAHRDFLAALARAKFEVRDEGVSGPCAGDLGNLCKRLSVPGLSPVNLSATVAQSVGARRPADLLVEVHLLRDFHVDDFWSAVSRDPQRERPALFVRAFNAQGKQVWEDQEMLDLPMTLSQETYGQNFDDAVAAAAGNVVARLAESTSARSR